MEINLRAPINPLGYGRIAQNLLPVFGGVGVTPALFPIGKIEVDIPSDSGIEPCIKNALIKAKLYNPHVPCVSIWHQHDLALRIGTGLHIGYPIFELDTFTDVENHHLYNCDAVFVCSKWAKRVVENNLYGAYKTLKSDLNVRVVPLGVDNKVFKWAPARRPRTVFLNVGKWERRKSHDLIPEIWKRAFTPHDEVELWMMPHNPFLTQVQIEQWRKPYETLKDLGYNVTIIPYQPTAQLVCTIMQQADCGFFPSRAEGWNLEALEMMACGKHIAITGYSAHTEFCDNKNSNIVEIDELEIADDGVWFKGQGYWAKLAEPQVEQFVQILRKIHEDKQANGPTMNKAGIETAEFFSWEHSARVMYQHLKELTNVLDVV